MLESGLVGASARGAEVNPGALLLARLYTLINIEPPARTTLLTDLDSRLRDHFGDVSLFKSTPGLPQDLQHLCDFRATLELDEQTTLLDAAIILSDFPRTAEPVDFLRHWTKVRDLVQKLPYSKAPIETFAADARDLPLPNDDVGLVITSPPYINVFNYHQQYRGSVEGLGYDVLDAARSEVGSNRKHRQNRFLTVIQYILDLSLAMKEMTRVAANGTRLILVVGRESNVLGTPFFNGAIIAEIGSKVLGLPITLRQERVFTNRFGKRIFEDILHFENKQVSGDVLGSARILAAEVLASAVRRSEPGVRRLIDGAGKQILEVDPSPRFTGRAGLPASPQVG
ncbi:hypothetical protein [Candidatus Palauibacter sp.]|uniref:hypothetical protein n=1 Tax=Candidatus Palauibacter sp. TaxID=3101350 RepID=UPI003C6F2A11